MPREWGRAVTLNRMLAALAALFMATCGGAAQAQSLFASPSAPWAGPYVGIHAGYGWDPDIVDTTGELLINQNATKNAVRPAFVSETRQGYIAGGQIGWNVQRGHFVAGIEADASLTDMGKKDIFHIPVRFGEAEKGRATRLNDRTTYLGTVRGRLGIAQGPLLFYGTGGFAYSHVRDDGLFDSSQLTHLDYEGHSSTDLNGWVAGGGVEYILPGNWRNHRATVRAEVLHYDLGDSSVFENHFMSTPTLKSVVPGSYTSTFHHGGEVVRIGLNLKF